MQQVMIRIPKELVEQIEKLAALEARSRSNMIMVLIEEALSVKKSLDI